MVPRLDTSGPLSSEPPCLQAGAASPKLRALRPELSRKTANYHVADGRLSTIEGDLKALRAYVKASWLADSSNCPAAVCECRSGERGGP